MPFYVRDWTGEVVGVEDAAAALILAAEKGRNGERYIISERFMSVRELYETAADAAGVDPPRFGVPLWAMYAMGYAGDVVRKRSAAIPADESQCAIDAHMAEAGPRQSRTGTGLAAQAGPRLDPPGRAVLSGESTGRQKQVVDYACLPQTRIHDQRVSEEFSLNLLGQFAVHRGDQPVELPPACQRLIALVALKRRPVHRLWVCAKLWPHAQTRRAIASLRSTMWRLRPVGADPLLEIDPQYIALAPGVSVDWYDAVDQIGLLLDHDEPAAVSPQFVAELLPLLRAGELLDGWAEPWASASASDTARCARPRVTR